MCRHGRAFIVVLAAIAAQPLAAEEICGVTQTVFKDGFEQANLLPTYSVPGAATPLTLAVVDPPANASVGLDRVVLQGSFTGPPNIGLVAYDHIAGRSNTQFVTPPIPLQPGANAITVQLHTIDGAGPSLVHHVTYDPALAPRAHLLAGRASAMAPTTIAFQVEKKAGEPLSLTRVRLDTNGDGSTDIDTTDLDVIRATYPQPGLFKVTGTATLDDGNPNTPAVDVPLKTWFLAEHPHQTRYALCSAFGTLRARLASQNIAGALKTLADHLHAQFEPFFTGLGPQLPTVATKLGTIIDGTYSLGTAELMLTRPMKNAPAKQQAYRVQLERDAHGVWLITAM